MESGRTARAFSGAINGVARTWDLAEAVLADLPQQVQYTNAKVVLLGESGAGKTGLSQRLGLNSWQPTDSTVGAWATQWKLPVASEDGVEREIWLWDFGGQADQRLIHQLYLDETAVAVLVFDGQKEDVFDTLGQWDRDLTRASHKHCSKLLVAGRIDAGGMRVSRSQLNEFASERGYPNCLETSAKMDTGCDELKQTILQAIDWQQIPWRTSPRIFKWLKDEIIRLKDDNRVLMRFNELRDHLQSRLSNEGGTIYRSAAEGRHRFAEPGPARCGNSGLEVGCFCNRNGLMPTPRRSSRRSVKIRWNADALRKKRCSLGN